MTPEQMSALVSARVARALIRAMGMQAQNMQRAAVGSSMAYDDAAFFALIDEECIGENSVIQYLSQGEYL